MTRCLELLLDLDAYRMNSLTALIILLLGRETVYASYSPDAPGEELRAAVRQDNSRLHSRVLRATPTASCSCSFRHIDYNEYVGRMAVGRIEARRAMQPEPGGYGLRLSTAKHEPYQVKGREAFIHLRRFGQGTAVTEARVSAILSAYSGIDGHYYRSDYLCGTSTADPTPLPFVKIGEPTSRDDILGKRQPVCGQRGQVCYLAPDTRERLHKELLKDVSLDSWRTARQPRCLSTLAGRGEMHLSILDRNNAPRRL